MTSEEAEARLRLYFKAGKRSAKLMDLEIDDIRFLKFKTIVEIKDAMEKANERTDFEILNAVFRDKGKVYEPKPGFEKQTVEFLMFIHDGIQGIANMEQDSFVPEASDVDTSGLDQFKELNIIDSIAGGDVLKWEAIQEQPYWNIFLKMLKNAEERKIEKMRIESSKNK